MWRACWAMLADRPAYRRTRIDPIFCPGPGQIFRRYSNAAGLTSGPNFSANYVRIKVTDLLWVTFDPFWVGAPRSVSGAVSRRRYRNRRGWPRTGSGPVMLDTAVRRSPAAVRMVAAGFAPSVMWRACWGSLCTIGNLLGCPRWAVARVVWFTFYGVGQTPRAPRGFTLRVGFGRIGTLVDAVLHGAVGVAQKE